MSCGFSERYLMNYIFVSCGHTLGMENNIIMYYNNIVLVHRSSFSLSEYIYQLSQIWKI